MKNILYIIFCFFIVKSGFSQDTFTYKTVKASDVTDATVQLVGAEDLSSQTLSKSSGFSAKGGTVTNGILGSLSVSPTGGASYTIPINVPPGLNGVVPEIALTYDSQSGKGIAGYGWNLSGVSSISRIPSTQYHDDKIDPVDFDLLDRFALDGQRLIIKTGTYGANGAVYQTEQYSNIKIISYGSHPVSGVEGPQYFKVFYPDGSIAHYGYSSNSRSHMDYAISHWENPQGIRINYSYTSNNNRLKIDKITYGARGAATPINEIEFEYTNGGLNYKDFSYINGTLFGSAYRLTDIKVSGNGTPYRNYVLSGFLGSVKEYTGDNQLNRSVTFAYGNTANTINKSDNTFNQINLGNVEKRNAKVISLDVSGDGKMDFIVYPTIGPDAKKKFWLFSDFQIGGVNWGTEANTGEFEAIFPVSWLNYQNKLLANQGLAVIQNSGSEQVKFKVYSSGGAIQPIAYKYEKTWTAPTYLQPSFPGPFTNRVPLRYLSGDFDGDGLSDVIAVEENHHGSSISKTHLIKLDRRITSNFTSYIGNLSSQLQSSDKLLVMDVNGDGKTDILQFREGKVYVYGLNDANTSLQLLWQTTNSDIKIDYPIMPGDYNGDGKSDFMIWKGASRLHFSTFLSKGNGFDIDSEYYPFGYESNYIENGTYYGYDLIPVDINGDGKTDIIDYSTETYDNNSNGKQTIKAYINRTSYYNNCCYKVDFYNGGSITDTGNLKTFPIPVFLTSDKPNNNLEIASISDKYVTSFEFTKDHREDTSLKTISNNGITTEIKYDQVNSYYQDPNDPFYYPSYTSGYGQIFPYVNVNVAPSFKVVRELVETGDNITRTKQFLYKGAVSHAGGLGFIGFEELKQTNWYGDGVGTLWTVSKHDPMLRNAITEKWVAETSSSSPGQYVSKTNYFYDYELIANPGSPSAPPYTENIIRNMTIPGQQTDEAEQTITLKEGFYSLGSNGTYWGKLVPPEQQPGASGYAGVTNLRLKKIEQDNGLTGVFTTVTYAYDEYNNPIETRRTFPGGSNTITFEYSNNAGATNNSYHVGRPTKNTETNILNGSTFSTEEQYSYNNNLIIQTKAKGHGTSWLTTDLVYDVNGNVTQKTISASGVSSRTETFEYTGYGQRFLTKSIDAQGLETTTAYNAVTGNPLTNTNPYGLVTTYEYDKWDRIIKEIDYLGQETIYDYIAQTGGGIKETIDYATGAKDETTYNAFGWAVKSGSLSLDNQWIYKSFEYDVAGRMTRESEPYIGSASQWNTFAYDGYGRMISRILFNGKSISTSYSNLTTTVVDGAKTIITTLDALGNVVSLQDPGGTINYTHHANGAIKTADYDGNVVSTNIDGWGRKISSNDPAAGNYAYSYNNYGEVLTETSPKGSTTYTYDAFGKPTSKIMTGDLTDHTLTYQYDNTTKLLTSITGQDNTNSRAYSYNYTYDNYKRPSTIKENTGLAEFELQYTYDTYGRVHKETQIGKNLGNAVSSTITTRNVYDASGMLSEIWNDGTTDKLWELDAINARGQALTINLGNGMSSTKAYDAYGYLTKIEDKETGSNPSPTVALHTTYSFNQQSGALTTRNNVGFNHQENFTYDNLNRLTSIGGAVTKTMTYDARGRITNNTDLGDYVYDSNSKYRLKEIAPNTAGETYFQSHPTQQVSFNAFKKPIDIHETGQGRVSFEYGPMMNRSHAYYGGDNADKLLRRYRKHYSSITGTEIVEDTQTGSTKIVTYVSGDAYTAPIAHIKRTVNNPIDEYHYLHRDYLGSILAITDADGDVIEERQFGAWGSVDKFSDSSSGIVFNHASLLDRGYTGHEHFFEVSLIHMNGRVYDPQVGRFLSPDNYIQDPFNTQNYNRYGYVLNNPLMYSDPSGELIECVVIAAVALLVGNAIFGDHDATPYDNSYEDWKNGQNAPTPNNIGNSAENTASINTPREPNPDLGSESPSWFDQYWSGYKEGYGSFWSNLGDSISESFSNAWNDPWGSWKKNMIDNGNWWKTLTGYKNLETIWDIGPGNIIRQMKSGYASFSNFIDGNYYEAGVIDGYRGGEGTLELATTVATAGIGKVAASAVTRNVVKNVVSRIPIKPIKFTTSSKSLAPSRTYAIYDEFGELYKFGVTDKNLGRYMQSLKEAGPGSTGKYSGIMTKQEAHMMEKYLRSLHYNSTGQYTLPGMKIPYPRDFDTMTPIKPE